MSVVNPPGYPTEWEADVLLADGGVARLRPIRPDDAELLVDFYDRVSPESKYLRFFAPYPRLSKKDVARFTQVDYIDRVAFILTLGERMIGVGRYDRIENDQAEVAFLVEDAHQGRGIAQLLLEHLADAARERGITEFVAEVLPQNRRMAQVFADAGYRVHQGYDEGVLMVDFPIWPTDTSVGVMERREHRAESRSISRLLSPERMVLLGPGARVQDLAAATVSGGFGGEVIAVSTDDCPVPGVPSASSVATVAGTIDLAVVSVPTSQLGAVVIDAAHKGVHGLVVLTGGGDGRGDNRTVVNLARAYGVRAIGPDALGLINTDAGVRLNASPAPMPRSGVVGLFCQSAAVGVSLLNYANSQDLGLSSFLSTGDFADVTGNDVLQYWEDDDRTAVCVLALDSIGNPRKFSRIVRRLTRRKPVVVFSPGRADRSDHHGVRGGLGHAPEAAVDAMFSQNGVIVVHRRQALFDIARICARQPLPGGRRVQLVTNSATLARQMAVTAAAAGLLLKPEPLILPTDADANALAGAASRALSDERCDSVVCTAVSPYDRDDRVRDALEDLAAHAGKPLIGVLLDFRGPPPASAEPDGMGKLAAFDSPGDAIRALGAVTEHAAWRSRDPGAVPLLDIDEAQGKRLVNRVLAQEPSGRALTEDEAAQLLGAYGIEMVAQTAAHSLDEAIAIGDTLGWDVVLKASSPALRSRPDQATVYRNIDNAEEMTDAWQDLTAVVSGLGFDSEQVVPAAAPVVQKMAPPGVAVVVASGEDAAFGPVVSLGLDGLASELLGDVVHRVPPLTTVDAAQMVRSLKAAPLLFGSDGAPGVQVAAVEDLLHRVAQLSDDVPQLASLALRPCVASLSGVAVLGASVHLAPTGDQRDPMARVL
ncbi:MAG: GNAT family N-acetyltransferase [Microlunatus sp.]|nr:GNAT family N-acetyltransferase [Microlunatus sp.]